MTLGVGVPDGVEVVVGVYVDEPVGVGVTDGNVAVLSFHWINRSTKAWGEFCGAIPPA